MSENHGGIIRVEKNRNYSVTNNTGAHDKRLSWGAKGILWYALTRPDNWVLTVKDLVSYASEGEAAVKARLKELKTCGYLKKERFSVNGNFEWRTTIYEVPQDADFSHSEINAPSGEIRPMVNPEIERETPSGGLHPMLLHPMQNRPIYKGLNKKELNKKELNVVEEERARKKTPQPPPPPQTTALAKHSNDSPIFAAIFEITGREPNLSYGRDKTELAALAPFLCERFANESAAANEMVRLFQFWEKATPPHLSQILQNWPRMERIEKLRQQQEQNATPIPKTANERRLEQHVRQRLESRDSGAQSSADASLERLAQRR